MHTKTELANAFAVFDADGNGNLSPDELKAILTRSVRGKPAPFTEEEVDELVKMFDTDNDGQLSVEEFAQAWASLSSGKASLEQLMEMVAAPAGEDFDDLVPEGAGCEISKTEERAITVEQLENVKAHIERRCPVEGWLDFKKEKLEWGQVSLYEACRHVIKPATEAKKTSYIELVAIAAQPPKWFTSHWWAAAFSCCPHSLPCLCNRHESVSSP